MSINSCFRRRLEKQHGKCAKAMLKSASEHFYHIHWSLPSQFSQKKSLLLTCQILGFLVNKLDSDDRYPVLNRDNLTIVGQMQLPQKQKTFSQFSAAFFKSRFNFKYFEKKDAARRFCISKITDFENVVRSMSKKSRFGGPLAKQHGKRAQALLNSA